MNKKFIIGGIAVLIFMAALILGSNLRAKKQTANVVTKNVEVASSNSGNNEIIEDNTTKNNNIEEKTNEDKNNQKDEGEKQEEKNKENVEEKKSEDPKAPTGNTTYYIKVNYKENCVTIYKKDDDGYYTVPTKAMICSCGTATPTSGVYKTSPGYEWGYLEGGTFGRYSTRIKGGIMFHSVPYVEESEDTLEYWEYDKLGTTASLGCVRLCVRDCKWIFDNCEVGTPVEFYASSDPGPLGKPTAQKISDNEECRNWDPTDPSPSNPWNNQ